MVFEGLQFGGGTASPTEVLQDLITVDDQIDLKTKFNNIKAIKSLIHLEVLNRIKNNKDSTKDAYDILLDVLNEKYKPYMASLDGYRSNQIIEGVKQFIQQIGLQPNTMESLAGKK